MSESPSSSTNEDTGFIIKKIVLRNAVQYGGKARSDNVISKVVAHSPTLRIQIKSLIPLIKSAVEEMNLLTLGEQKELLARISPGGHDDEIRKKKGKHRILPELPNAQIGRVVTRFPPEPNGYPHIGHAKAAVIDEEYARTYNGKLILRFDDTNPLNEKIEYYESIKEGLEWLGIKPDLVKNTSDDVRLLCDYGKKLVRIGGAYVCTCSQTKIRELRAKGVPCECRSDSVQPEDRLRTFFDGSFEPNAAVIRFKGNVADANTAMRDPTLFRIIDAQHPKLGSSNRLWPTYDFAAPIEDSLDGVTHALRTKEYELRNALYYSILERLSLRRPILLEFSRLEFEGMPVSKRKIIPLINKGLVQGWADPRLPTLAALKGRGFTPQAIRKFVLSLGLTLSETTPPFESLEAFNRKIIDPLSIRLFFVKYPSILMVRNTPSQEVILNNHPNRDLGRRRIIVSDTFYIDGDDATGTRVGDEIRLMELYNVLITDADEKVPVQPSPLQTGNINSAVKIEKLLIAERSGEAIKHNMRKIQWVAKNDALPYQILVPKQLYFGENYNVNSLESCQGYAESFIASLDRGTSIQFVRFGFCSLNNTNTAIFTHR
jgi:glutamyl-tRNA synthetase